MKRLAAAVLLVLAAAPPAFAQRYGEHAGFFLRPRVGVAEWDATGAGWDTYGPGGFFSVDVGGSFRRNLQIYGELRGSTVDAPQQSDPAGNTVILDGWQASMSGIGGGVSYYFEPINLYVGGTLLLVNASIPLPCTAGECQFDTDWGVGLSVDAGKEWMVSPSWGLGVGADLFLGSMTLPSGGSSYDISASTFAVVFTATYD